MRYVLLNEDVGGELLRGFYGAPFGTALTHFIAAWTSPVRVWSDATYGGSRSATSSDRAWRWLRAVKPSCTGE